MYYPVQSFVKQFPKYCVVSDVFSKEEVEKIIDLEDLQKFQRGSLPGIGDPNIPRIDTAVRDSETAFINADRNSDWLYSKFADLVSHVNYDMFLYNISALNFFQYTIYKENQHYDWHIDAHYDQKTAMQRKISAVVILTGPNEYEGGELELIVHGRVSDPIILKPNAGDVVFFDSIFPHRVSPVTNGVRKTLVTWVEGANNV